MFKKDFHPWCCWASLGVYSIRWSLQLDKADTWSVSTCVCVCVCVHVCVCQCVRVRVEFYSIIHCSTILKLFLSSDSETQTIAQAKTSFNSLFNPHVHA